MLTIRLENSGGELDARDAETPAEAAKAAIEIIRAAGELHDGDTITITYAKGETS